MNIFIPLGLPSIKKTVYLNASVFEHTADNFSLMLKCKAPIGIDGLPVTLHHIGRKKDSPLAVVTDTFHNKHTNVIHNLDPPNGQEVNRKAFNSECKKVWKAIAWFISMFKERPPF